MPYNSRNYRGVTPYGLLLGPKTTTREAAAPEAPVPASSTIAGKFADVIQSVRPPRDKGLRSFGVILQDEGRPINATFHPEEDRHYSPAADQPLGLAAAYNIAERRRWLWKRGRNPGIYTVSRAIFVEPDENGDKANLQARVQETTRSFAAYGDPAETIITRPAGEDEVAQAIETIIAAAAGAAAEQTPQPHFSYT
jgi:hypothetical protein